MNDWTEDQRRSAYALSFYIPIFIMDVVIAQVDKSQLFAWLALLMLFFILHCAKRLFLSPYGHKTYIDHVEAWFKRKFSKK